MIEREPKFQTIGKGLPYSVPNNFFEKLPDQTLGLAKVRMEKRRRNKKRIRFVAVFTSAAVLLLFVVMPHREWRTETTQAENIDVVLQSLSDEDLTQMTAIYGAEDLTNDLSQ
jgi:type VI protein secretion system component VasK